MRELTACEINLVNGGGVSTSEGAGAVIGYLSSQQPSNPYATITAERLRAYRAANPDSRTWYADFFNL